ncbi:hypothetical protein [Methylobacterium iners]|uniref:Uncharacterized protein n=1 Tax=Methylobacterium iners TaxID=418707 RepID=A0ABQ4S3P6_9HYPH|nr:hypothetical protein [Methylobacterium iners]GJD97099.1 hypothetical protein OCOJLMKI_4327 [Methylobacterium iners]
MVQNGTVDRQVRGGLSCRKAARFGIVSLGLIAMVFWAGMIAASVIGLVIHL